MSDLQQRFTHLMEETKKELRSTLRQRRLIVRRTKQLGDPHDEVKDLELQIYRIGENIEALCVGEFQYALAFTLVESPSWLDLFALVGAEAAFHRVYELKLPATEEDMDLLRLGLYGFKTIELDAPRRKIVFFTRGDHAMLCKLKFNSMSCWLSMLTPS